jgi:hypothetical protein
VRSHGHTHYDHCIDDSQDQIAELERFMSASGITVQEETHVINPWQIQLDLIEVIVVIDCIGERTVEGDIDGCGVICQGGGRLCIGRSLDICVAGAKGREVGVEKGKGASLGVVDDEQVAIPAIGATIVDGVVVDMVHLAIRVHGELGWVVQHVLVPDCEYCLPLSLPYEKSK